ncbi:MAG: rhodanese-like domain-containing protein [Crocinitomicaceae bacterium]
MKKTHLIILSALIFTLTSCSIRRLEKMNVYKEVSAESFEELLKEPDINIIDVRTRSEFEKSHISGAQNASYFSGHFDELVDSLNLDTSRKTLIYCETQHRSLFAAKKLYKAGFKTIVDLDKGMLHWRKNDFPYVESDSISHIKDTLK